MATLENLKEEMAPHYNTLVLDGFDVVRLVNVVDEELDFYWVYDTPKGVRYSSCCVGYIPLKDNLKHEDYNRLLRLWNLNNEINAI